MRKQIYGTSAKYWFTANETANWASKWPCSELAGNSLFVEFSGGDLVDIAFNGKSGGDASCDELNAFLEDMLGTSNPQQYAYKAGYSEGSEIKWQVHHCNHRLGITRINKFNYEEKCEQVFVPMEDVPELIKALKKGLKTTEQSRWIGATYPVKRGVK